MKKLVILFIIIVIGCGTSKKATIETEDNAVVMESPETSETPKAQKTIQMQKNMLLGEFEKEELQQKPFSVWFEPGYTNYAVNGDALETIKNTISDYEITVFMGTWCHDSKREMPKFIKLLDEVNYNYDKLTMIAVDRGKNTPTGMGKEFDIIRVPTIIFYKNGKEVNRFVEYAQESFEKDIAKIVSGEDYKNSYAE